MGGPNNPDGNPKSPEELLKMGEATQFGKGQDPKEVREKGPVDRYSIRRAIRRISGAQVQGAMNIADKEKAKEEFIKIVAKELGYEPNELTLGMLTAIKKFQLALSGDVKAMSELENSVDGKLVDRKIEAQTSLADLIRMSYKLEEQNGNGNSA